MLSIVAAESGLSEDAPIIDLESRRGVIHSNLSIGANLTTSNRLLANSGICANGMLLSGGGFVVRASEAELLGRSSRQGLRQRIRPYLKGKALYDGWKDTYAIDLFNLSETDVREQYPEVYAHLLGAVKPERVGNIKSYREKYWWIFGENNPKYRGALSGIGRYISTVETAKHRIFQLIDRSFLHDHMVVGVAIDDAAIMALLSSRPHLTWAIAQGGTLEDRPRYNKTRCFDTFPFPPSDGDLRERLAALGEELDRTRKLVLADYPELTLTGLYNLIEKVKAGSALTPSEEDAKQRGRVLILKELHDQIDALTAQAYGWPADLGDDDILARLVALNAERAREEAAGHVRWLRPDYQIPRFAKGAVAKTGELDLGETVVAIDKGLPTFPTDRYEQPLAVEAMLLAAGRPMDPAELSRGFKRGGKRIEQRVVQVLTTLVRYGRLVALDDGKYAARRAA